MITGGLKVGWSTDMDAAVFADVLDVDMVYKISNINYVYEEDPRVNPNTPIIKDLSWQDYFEQFNILEDSFHKANDNIPIDIVVLDFALRRIFPFYYRRRLSI